MKFSILGLFLSMTLASTAWAMEDGEDRLNSGKVEVYSEQTKRWIDPDAYFSQEIKRIQSEKGSKHYGDIRGGKYPPYESVGEWDVLVDILPDNRQCPMVFFHNRWRRLPDVLALSSQMRNWGGCQDVFNY